MASDQLHIKRDCYCPRARHQHGTRGAYQKDRCRCFKCRLGYSRIRSGQQSIAGTWVTPIGIQRRIQALNAAGWTAWQLARRMGVSHQAIKDLRDHPRDRSYTATLDRVVALYDSLWDKQPPVGAGKTSTGPITCIKQRAAANGWVPPLAWDDDSIDDPDARPYMVALNVDPLLDEVEVERFMAGTHALLPPLARSPERLEAIRRLAARGIPDTEIGRRVGMSGDAVCQTRIRRGIASTVPVAAPWHSSSRSVVRRRAATGTEKGAA